MLLPSRRQCLYLTGALCLLSLVAGAVEPPITGINPVDYLEHVKFLSSAKLEGRATGDSELDRAADYIADQFASFGLEPLRSRKYFQEFTVTTNARLGKSNSLSYELEGQHHDLKLGREFIPLNFSGRGRATAPVVFVGYGITAPEYGYDDYAGVDTRGKFVLVMRHEPQEYDADSVFAGKIYTEHSQLYSKAVNARRHGARGIIYVNDIASHGGSHGDLEKFVGEVGPTDAFVPFVHVGVAVVQKWLALSGEDLKELQRSIDEKLRPRSFVLPESLHVSVRVDIRRNQKRVENVAGYLPGESSEHVIIGAHYDHIGHGEQFSMAPAQAGTIHPGADDNASGTAGLLELARWFSAHPPRGRGLLFLAFAGEELGLLGSSHYVRHPLLPLDDAVAMLNMDMIGRLRDERIYVGGVRTGSSFPSILKRCLAPTTLQADLATTSGYGSSDHTSFTTREVPVLFFFTGLHEDYHRPTDTWEKITAAETARLLDLIAAVTTDLAEGVERPAFSGTAELTSSDSQH